ncbi:MAG: hypothetical protein ACRDTE_19540 [Pseudonocardiaceae bacterium]
MSPPGSGAPRCATHGRISDELRAVIEQLAGRLQPWLERMAQDSAPGQPEQDPGQAGQDPGRAAEPCTWCPLCALITVLRGDRPEAAARLAEHGAGLIAAARELLTPPAEPAPQHAAEGERAQRQASVQHIVVRPAAGGPGGVAGC